MLKIINMIRTYDDIVKSKSNFQNKPKISETWLKIYDMCQH